MENGAFFPKCFQIHDISKNSKKALLWSKGLMMVEFKSKICLLLNMPKIILCLAFNSESLLRIINYNVYSTTKETHQSLLRATMEIIFKS